MKITKDQLLNFLTDLSITYELPPLIEKVEEVIEALQNEELEIEGYERNGWIKFNPDDERTYPPVGEQITVYYDPDLIDDEEYKFGFAVFLNTPFPPWLTYWRRPLTPPPGKEEKCG